jgi:hypothetical protein
MSHSDAANYLSELIEQIYTRAGNYIEAEIRNGKRALITALSEKIAGETNSDKVFCYYIISAYVKMRKDVKVYMGKNGGIGLVEESLRS